MNEGLRSIEIASIEKNICSFLADQFFVACGEQLSRDQNLFGTIIDSTGVLVLVTYLQEQFEIVVDDDDVVPENLDSVQKMAAYVVRKLQSKSQPTQA